jgi:acetyltransferase-like isoleucine patch superfamily enzyme
MVNIFDKTAKISKYAIIDTSSRGTSTHIGAESDIDAFVRIKHVGGSGDVIIGCGVYINSGTVIYSGNGVKIGDNVLIGPNCSITAVNHKYKDKGNIIKNQRFMDSKGGIIIEEDVWLGAGVTVLDGAVIKRGAVIGAMSLVNGVVEEYSINAGVPCKKIGERK